MNTRDRGSDGENSAADYLLSTGYTIITRNYQTRDGEIDCIARAPDGTVAFIEVKYGRAGSRAGHPFFRITRAKQRKLVLMARRWLADHRMATTPCRFDAIAVIGGRVEHLKNAFLV